MGIMAGSVIGRLEIYSFAFEKQTEEKNGESDRSLRKQGKRHAEA